MKERVISLGKTIVQELGVEPGADTLSRWMAHYIAELIANAETASSDDKYDLEKECFETILKVWKRRSHFPNGRRPFEEFELIFNTLQNLSPDSYKSFTRPLSELVNKEEKSDGGTEVANWLKRTIEITKFTNRLQRYYLSEAFHCAENEKTKQWLEHIKDPELFDDTRAIMELKWYSEEFKGMSEENQDKTLKKKGYQSLLSDIDTHIGLLNQVRESLRNRIEESE